MGFRLLSTAYRSGMCRGYRGILEDQNEKGLSGNFGCSRASPSL